MKIQVQQLVPYLTKGLAPLYLISGDEFLLVQEAVDTIRKYATAAGYTERDVYHIETGFNWENFLSNISNTSLFGDRALVELHLKSKLSDSGNKILQNYAKKPIPDKIILIVADKLDAAQQKTAWFKAVESVGVILQLWPIEPAQVPLWINNRLKAAGLKTDSQGIQLLVDHISGNLLAAVQEIEKLRLLYGEGNLTVEQISAAITDNSRFSIFNLVDAALGGNASDVSRILDNLQGENIEPVLILWAITNELRSLINMSFILTQGLNVDQIITQYRVRFNRVQLIKKALTKYRLDKLQKLLQRAAAIDLIIKGADSQHLLWHELKNIYLDLAI